MLQAGDAVDRYVVEARLGSGATSDVYRVRHSALGSLHALKVLKVPHPTLKARLLREGRVMAGMRHPNVVGVSDVVELGGLPALVLDLVDGPTLEDWLRTTTPPLPEALELFRGILAGVAVAHAAGLVHRDLKPSNVLLHRSPAGVWIPKVADFGLVTDQQGDLSLTRTGVGIGTPAWMAPEQLRNARAVDHRADIFSLGCILYRLVCGVQPFRSDDLMVLITDMSSGRYARPKAPESELPPAVVQALDGALAPNPDDRIPTCTALLLALDAPVAAPEPPPASEETAAPPPANVQTWVRALPSWTKGVGAVAGLAVVVGAGMMWGSAPPTTEPGTPAAAPSQTVVAPPTDVQPVVENDHIEVGSVDSEAEGAASAAVPEDASPSGTEGASSTDSPPVAASSGGSASAQPVPTRSTPDPSPPPRTPQTEDPPTEAPPAPATQAPVWPPAPVDASEPGHVSVRGAHVVVLDGPDGRRDPGVVPPGRYALLSTFGGPTLLPAGSLVVAPGARVTLRCNAIARTCGP